MRLSWLAPGSDYRVRVLHLAEEDSAQIWFPPYTMSALTSSHSVDINTRH